MLFAVLIKAIRQTPAPNIYKAFINPTSMVTNASVTIANNIVRIIINLSSINKNPFGVTAKFPKGEAKRPFKGSGYGLKIPHKG